MSEVLNLSGLKTLSRLRLFVVCHCSDPGVCYSSPGAGENTWIQPLHSCIQGLMSTGGQAVFSEYPELGVC